MEGGCRREHEEEGEREAKRERDSEEAPCAGAAGSYSLAPSTSISVSNVKEDKCIVLDNLFDGAVERDDIFYLRVRNHLHGNSAECGPVHHMHVDKKCGRVYMLFDSWRTANKAADKWHQSSYQGNVITVPFSDTAEYESRFEAEFPPIVSYHPFLSSLPLSSVSPDTVRTAASTKMRERKEAAEAPRPAGEMEGGGRRDHEAERDQWPEREREKEEEGEREDKNRERESDEAACAGDAGSYSLAPSTSISVSNVKEDKCIVLDNLFDGAVERDDIFYLRVRNHLHGNSAECGPVHHMHVDNWRTANKAADKWHQSSYQGNVITVSFSDTAEYESRFEAELVEESS